MLINMYDFYLHFIYVNKLIIRSKLIVTIYYLNLRVY